MYLFRKANNSDESILLDWINDPLSREMSLNSELITPEVHKIWFHRALHSKKIELYIYEKIIKNRKVAPVANLRIERKNKRKYLSWNVSGEMRNKGIGGRMLVDFVKEFKGNYFAIIKANNKASMAICEKSGFKKYYSRENLTFWKNF